MEALGTIVFLMFIGLIILLNEKFKDTQEIKELNQINGTLLSSLLESEAEIDKLNEVTFNLSNENATPELHTIIEFN